jgi:hypothetical protein
MNTTTRSVIAICFSIVTISIALSKCQQRRIKEYQFEHTWTPELEQQIRDVLYTQTSNITASVAISDSAKNAYVDCCFAKIKELFPEGLSGMEHGKITDSTKIALMKACANCTTILTKQIDVWQPEVVQQLKLQLYSYPEVKFLPKAAKSEYVDCLTFKIKTRFPKGLKVAGKDSVKKVIEKAREECVRLLTNKYGKQKLKDTSDNK